MEPLTLVLFVIGLALLLVGAEVLVRGASRLAAALGIPPLVVGLTVVSFCTSSPELAVSISSALAGEADLALGNVVGSNIFNILFILGVSAMVAPLMVKMQLIRLDVPIALGASILVFVMGLSGAISRPAGALLFAGIIAYIAVLIRQTRREKSAVQAEFTQAAGTPARDAKAMLLYIGMIAGGLALLVVGSDWMVDGAVAIARFFNVSDVLIGLTIIAAGTSLPEIATSVLASARGERDIAVGNVIGSCIFNLLAVLGLTALFSPVGVPVPADMPRFELPIMIAITALCIPIFYIGMNVTRGEGGALLGLYIALTVFLILKGIAHPLADAVGVVLALLFGIAFVIFFAQAFVDRRKRQMQSSF
jgi:cation:H+ antiporter